MNVWLLGTFKNIIGINGGAMILHSIVNAFYKLIIKKNMFILFLGTFYYICNIKEYHTINIEKKLCGLLHTLHVCHQRKFTTYRNNQSSNTPLIEEITAVCRLHTQTNCLQIQINQSTQYVNSKITEF